MRWKEALAAGDAAYFNALIGELKELNSFGGTIGLPDFGVNLIEQLYGSDEFHPIRAAQLHDSDLFQAFGSDFVTGAYVLNESVDLPGSTPKGVASGAAVGALVSQPVQGKNAMIKSLPIGKINEAIRDHAALVFNDEALAEPALFILAFESPKVTVDGTAHIQTNAVGPGRTAAQGLFQFTSPAWIEAGRVKAASGQTVGSIIGPFSNAMNADANIIAALALIIRNRQIAKSVGLDVSSGLLATKEFAYIMHNQGVGGAKALLQATGAQAAYQVRNESSAVKQLVRDFKTIQTKG